MAVDASPTTVRGNYVASSQPGCHIAHYSAEWIIEASAFEAEDYGLQPGEEEGVPDIIVDPETRSLRSGTLDDNGSSLPCFESRCFHA